MAIAGQLRREVPISLADVTDTEKKKVLAVLDTNFLSRGPIIQEFEERLSAYLGIPYVIAVNNGTAALHLSVKSLGISNDDEVITTPFSFVSSSNCLLMEKAKPIFVDIDPETYNINPSLIESKINSRTKAILPADIFGYPCEMDKIREVAEKYNLPIIEDSCEALGAEYNGKKVGGESTLSVLSFFPNKQITTGEGGAIVTPRRDLAELCRSMRNHGKPDSKVAYTERMGYNYWMNEINAALGVAQIDRIEEILSRREDIAERYIEKLSSLEEVTLPVKNTQNKKRSWFVFVIGVEESKRNQIMTYLQNNGVGCREYFPTIHLQPLYTNQFGYKRGDFPIAERISRQTIAIPFYNKLSEEDMDYVVTQIKEALIKTQ
ncbi:MAG: DegT/DnrJ/EryC1/StrS family aminotransferase [Nanoarchaeota archaeon]|nr:DegT/DnrJ/EryC1/StrS family aminotransferase [Nanoarchaeota archaeon]